MPPKIKAMILKVFQAGILEHTLRVRVEFKTLMTRNVLNILLQKFRNQKAMNKLQRKMVKMATAIKVQKTQEDLDILKDKTLLKHLNN